MTEEQARDWIGARFGEEKLDILKAYVALLLDANQGQNLIGRASEPQVWTRHILDSAQLNQFAPEAPEWLDIGSGPGLPGLVLAILTAKPIFLVEPRRKRVEFLRHVAGKLELASATICQATIERLPPRKFGAVTARAFAPLPLLIESTLRLTDSSTIWVLPKGRGAEQELAEAQRSWQGTFHVEHSLTDDDARIIVATGIRPR